MALADGGAAVRPAPGDMAATTNGAAAVRSRQRQAATMSEAAASAIGCRRVRCRQQHKVRTDAGFRGRIHSDRYATFCVCVHHPSSSFRPGRPENSRSSASEIATAVVRWRRTDDQCRAIGQPDAVVGRHRRTGMDAGPDHRYGRIRFCAGVLCRVRFVFVHLRRVLPPPPSHTTDTPIFVLFVLCSVHQPVRPSVSVRARRSLFISCVCCVCVIHLYTSRGRMRSRQNHHRLLSLSLSFSLSIVSIFICVCFIFRMSNERRRN